MDDAVSVRPVPYENVQANDRALTQWMDNLPQELDLDDYRVARSLASTNTAVRRLGVQSVIIRTSYYHIRFTLHRPYASANANSSKSKPSSIEPSKCAQSLEIAVGAADKLITMTGQSHPDFLANSSLAVPGHMNWGPFHCFSAAMFFSFQLIANPDQPGAGLFRASIRKAITTLEQSRGVAVADKSLDILQALAPLYSTDFPLESTDVREKQRAQIFGTVRKLAFPYHDSHDPRRFGESPGGRGTMSSPANSSSVSPPMSMISTLPQQYDSIQSHTLPLCIPSSTFPTHQQTLTHTAHMQNMSQSPQSQVITHSQNLTPTPTAYQPTYTMHPQQHPIYSDPIRYQYGHPVDDSMWGAAIGFGQGEWTQFLDGLRPEVSSSNRHLQGT